MEELQKDIMIFRDVMLVASLSSNVLEATGCSKMLIPMY
jgi:hypothetical protein